MNSTNKNIDIHTLDKTIVYLNSDAVTFSSSNFDISFKLPEAIKNVVYIKIMKVDIILDMANVNARIITNRDQILEGDPLFINLRNFNNRIITKSIDDDIIKSFELINLNFKEKYDVDVSTGTLGKWYFKTEYTATGCNTTDTNVLVLNPIEPNVNRFDMQIYNKYNKLMTKNAIIKSTLTMCIYHSRKSLNNF
jgi:hypothetical protein